MSRAREDRGLISRLGGGDLDGDGKLRRKPRLIHQDFTVIWDQRFVRPLKVHEPMDYAAPPPKKVQEVTQYELNECFVQYILVSCPQGICS